MVCAGEGRRTRARRATTACRHGGTPTHGPGERRRPRARRATTSCRTPAAQRCLPQWRGYYLHGSLRAQVIREREREKGEGERGRAFRALPSRHRLACTVHAVAPAATCLLVVQMPRGASVKTPPFEPRRRSWRVPVRRCKQLRRVRAVSGRSPDTDCSSGAVDVLQLWAGIHST